MAALNSTTYTKQVAGTSPKPGKGLAATLKVVQVVVAIPVSGTGTNVNDTIGLFVLPKGCVLRGFSIRTDRLDTDASPLLALSAGYSGAATAFVSSWLGAKSVVTALSPNTVEASIGNYGYTPTADTPIYATVSAAGATKAAGTLVATMTYEDPGAATS